MARRDGVLVSRALYQIGLVTLVASIVWVGVGVYVALTKKPDLSIEKNILDPVNPTLNQKVMNELMGRENVTIEIETDVQVSAEDESTN